MDIPVGAGWQVRVDESPEWLFLTLVRTEAMPASELPLAVVVWELAESRGRRRLVFELGDGVQLTSFIVGQIVLIHKRAQLAKGVFRLCGLPGHAYSTLRMMGMTDRFPNYRTREDAVLGRLP